MARYGEAFRTGWWRGCCRRRAPRSARFEDANRSSEPEFDFVFAGSYWGSEWDVVGALASLGEEFRGAIFG